MKLVRLFNFPYYIVLISIFLPLLSVFLWIEMHRIILVCCVYLFLILLLSKKEKLIFSKSSLVLLALFSLLFLYDQAIGRGLFYFSNSHLVIYTFIFYNCFLISEKSIDDDIKLINQTNKIYYLILTFMFLELGVQISGSNILYSLFSRGGDFESIIQVYREYHNRFAAAVGLKITALNSLVLGNQIAGQLNLYAMIWFLPFYYKINRELLRANRKIWFSIALFLFIISPTMTSSILLIITLLLFLFYLRISKLNSLKSRLISSITILMFSGFLLKFLFPLFFNNELSDSTKTFFSPEGYAFSGALSYYIFGMLYPLFYYFDLSFFDKIFGAMNPESLWAELGFLKLLITNGALWLLLFFAPIILIIRSSFKLSKNLSFKINSISKREKLLKKWIWLAQVNALICFVNVLSLIHYIVIFKLGAIQLFAFHLSVTLFAIRKVKLLKNEYLI